MQSLVWFILVNTKVQSSVPSKKVVKLMWDKADLYRFLLLYVAAAVIQDHYPNLCSILCDHCMCSEQHELLLDKYYNDIVNCLATSSEQSFLSERVGFQTFWWTEELDDLKAATMEPPLYGSVLAALVVALLTKTGCSANTDTNLP